ncbi:hypothetical protein [Streptomyces sp. GQFP]|uniref:hypothetical protein n=1 Tax=Streptomyces sp. GQFP TaxID=2907545 RepID=UPI001F488213|nr:hypothetical protein [Streptomyces sp. GQFP]UIX35065.1 hypothetical protein LUX31_36505 [Streptomyces sp. GQFP]
MPDAGAGGAEKATEGAGVAAWAAEGVTGNEEAGVAARATTSAEDVCRIGVPDAGVGVGVGVGEVATGIAGVIADPVEAAARCTGVGFDPTGAELDAAEGPTSPGGPAVGLAGVATTGRAGAMPRATAGVVDVPEEADPGLGGAATGRTGAAVGPAGSVSLCTTGGATGTGTREFGAEPRDTRGASTGLAGAPVDAVEPVDVCTTAALDAVAAGAGPDDVTAGRPAAAADATGPVPGTGPGEVVAGPAEAADLCTAAGASTGRADAAAAAPGAPGVN